MYVRDDLHYTKCLDLSVIIEGKIESIFIESNKGNQNIIIGTIYWPSSRSKKDSDNPHAATHKGNLMYTCIQCMGSNSY